jgi:type II secretory pathway component GspD/PulD (secretin)
MEVRIPATSVRWSLMLVQLALAAIASAQPLEILELRHRTVEEVIPVLQPLMEAGGVLTGKDGKLFVRTSGANLAELRRALAELDVPARQLLIAVRRSTAQEIERAAVSGSAVVRSTRGTSVPHGTTANVSVQATHDDVREKADGVSSVLVLEGGAAYVSSGETVPLVTAIAAGGGRRPWAAAQVEYRDLASGFLVKPRLAGERVVIDISQSSDARSERDGARIVTGRLETQVTARPGEWVQLGGIEETRNSRNQGIATRQHSTASDVRSLWVKVEIMAY